MRIRNSPKSRGVAMLLVLISLMTASVLTIAYVSSRDNSAIIGDNVTSSAAARWNADAGLDLALAALQTEIDWRTMHTMGKLVDDHALGNGTVDVDLLDLATDLPPTSLTEYVQITSTSWVNGVQQSSMANAFVPSPQTHGMDVDLSEFAIFASERIELEGDAIVMHWPSAKLMLMNTPVALGTQGTSAGTVTINNNAAAIDSTVFAGPGASGSLVISANGSAPGVKALLDQIPMPAPAAHGAPGPGGGPFPIMDILGGNGIITSDLHVENATLAGDASRVLQGDIRLTSNQDLMLANSKLVIDGQVRIVVFDDLSLQNSSIELRPGAQLLMHVADAIDLTDSYIGEIRADSVRDASGAAPYMNPDRVQIFRMPEQTLGANWTIAANSVVKGSLYGRGVQFELREQSALYGRVAATRVRVRDQAGLFYDPRLNKRSGFTEPDSNVFQADGHIRPEILGLASLDDSNLQAIADTLDTTVSSTINLGGGLLFPGGQAPAPPPTVPPDQPTPRPVHIVYQILSSGSSIKEWENAN